MAEWFTPTTITDAWLDAPDEPELSLVVEAALEQVLAYAPALPENTDPPARYVQAQLLQTRNLWNASKVSPGGDFSDGEFVLRPHPLDWQVKALLRPKRGIPVIG